MAFTIVATFQFSDSDDLKKTLPFLMAHGERCLADEPGTLQFDFSHVRNDDCKLFVYEVYQDKDAFKSHASGESLKELDADIENLGVEFEMTPVFGAGVK
jgi:quinol monooxygenase YgiN